MVRYHKKNNCKIYNFLDLKIPLNIFYTLLCCLIISVYFEISWIFKISRFVSETHFQGEKQHCDPKSFSTIWKLEPTYNPSTGERSRYLGDIMPFEGKGLASATYFFKIRGQVPHFRPRFGRPSIQIYYIG